MKKRILILLFLLFAVFQLSGCAKKYGCKDDEALNYDPFAEKYSPGCVYGLNVQFYIKQPESEYLSDMGCLFYSVFVNGEYVGSDDASHFVPKDKTVIIFSDTVGVNNSYYAEIEIRDQEANTIYRYYNNFSPGEDIVQERLKFFD